jgi:hypothetical protein
VSILNSSCTELSLGGIEARQTSLGVSLALSNIHATCTGAYSATGPIGASGTVRVSLGDNSSITLGLRWGFGGSAGMLDSIGLESCNASLALDELLVTGIGFDLGALLPTLGPAISPLVCELLGMPVFSELVPTLFSQLDVVLAPFLNVQAEPLNPPLLPAPSPGALSWSELEWLSGSLSRLSDGTLDFGGSALNLTSLFLGAGTVELIPSLFLQPLSVRVETGVVGTIELEVHSASVRGLGSIGSARLLPAALSESARERIRAAGGDESLANSSFLLELSSAELVVELNATLSIATEGLATTACEPIELELTIGRPSFAAVVNVPVLTERLQLLAIIRQLSDRNALSRALSCALIALDIGSTGPAVLDASFASLGVRLSSRTQTTVLLETLAAIETTVRSLEPPLRTPLVTIFGNALRGPIKRILMQAMQSALAGAQAAYPCQALPPVSAPLAPPSGALAKSEDARSIRLLAQVAELLREVDALPAQVSAWVRALLAGTAYAGGTVSLNLAAVSSWRMPMGLGDLTLELIDASVSGLFALEQLVPLVPLAAPLVEPARASREEEANDGLAWTLVGWQRLAAKLRLRVVWSERSGSSRPLELRAQASLAVSSPSINLTTSLVLNRTIVRSLFIADLAAEGPSRVCLAALLSDAVHIRDWELGGSLEELALDARLVDEGSFAAGELRAAPPAAETALAIALALANGAFSAIATEGGSRTLITTLQELDVVFGGALDASLQSLVGQSLVGSSLGGGADQRARLADECPALAPDGSAARSKRPRDSTVESMQRREPDYIDWASNSATTGLRRVVEDVLGADGLNALIEAGLRVAARGQGRDVAEGGGSYRVAGELASVALDLGAEFGRIALRVTDLAVDNIDSLRSVELLRQEDRTSPRRSTRPPLLNNSIEIGGGSSRALTTSVRLGFEAYGLGLALRSTIELSLALTGLLAAAERVDARVDVHRLLAIQLEQLILGISPPEEQAPLFTCLVASAAEGGVRIGKLRADVELARVRISRAVAEGNASADGRPLNLALLSNRLAAADDALTRLLNLALEFGLPVLLPLANEAIERELKLADAHCTGAPKPPSDSPNPSRDDSALSRALLVATLLVSTALFCSPCFCLCALSCYRRATRRTTAAAAKGDDAGERGAGRGAVADATVERGRRESTGCAAAADASELGIFSSGRSSRWSGQSLAAQTHPAVAWGVAASVLLCTSLFMWSNSEDGASVILHISTPFGLVASPPPLLRMSLASTVEDMWAAGAYPLAVLIAFFSGGESPAAASSSSPLLRRFTLSLSLALLIMCRRAVYLAPLLCVLPFPSVARLRLAARRLALHQAHAAPRLVAHALWPAAGRTARPLARLLARRGKMERDRRDSLAAARGRLPL